MAIETYEGLEALVHLLRNGPHLEGHKAILLVSGLGKQDTAVELVKQVENHIKRGEQAKDGYLFLKASDNLKIEVVYFDD